MDLLRAPPRRQTGPLSGATFPPDGGPFVRIRTGSAGDGHRTRELPEAGKRRRQKINLY